MHAVAQEAHASRLTPAMGAQGVQCAEIGEGKTTSCTDRSSGRLWMLSSAREPVESTLRRSCGAILAWGMCSNDTASTFSKMPDVAADSKRLPAAPSKSRGSSSATMPSLSLAHISKALWAVSYTYARSAVEERLMAAPMCFETSICATSAIPRRRFGAGAARHACADGASESQAASESQSASEAQQATDTLRADARSAEASLLGR